MSEALINDSQLMSYLLTHEINYRDYNYKSSMEKDINTEEFKMKNPFIVKHKKFYNNPFFWSAVIDKELDIVINSLFLHHSSSLDEDVLSAVIQTPKAKKSVVKKVMTVVYDNYKTINRSFRIEDIMMDAIYAKNLDGLKMLVEFANEHHIKPLKDNFGNIGDELGFNEAAKLDFEIVKYLHSLGAKVDCYGNWPYYNALKHGQFRTAKYLLDNGADPKQRMNVAKMAIKHSFITVKDITEEDKSAFPYFESLYNIGEESSEN